MVVDVGDLRVVGRPGRSKTRKSARRHVADDSAAAAHHPDVRVSVTLAREDDLVAGCVPGGVTVRKRMVGQ